ncbi:MAG TPA: Nramp family divalent metal transporter [Ktedonobacterales bacterium]|nr:Nramp family divalent metal transporter [Ktedonobacterales bacterium]
MALMAERVKGRRAAQAVAVGDRRTVAAAQATLAGKSRGIWRVLPFLGPAFIASVAYIDPGNFATNIQGGSAFGYQLLWVILASNLFAVLLQTLSAKLGIATGHNLPEICAKYLPRRVNLGLWLMAELAAMATDLAEFVGASLGFYLLLHIPLFLAGLLTGVVTFLLLGMRRFGFRPLEATIIVLVAVIAGSYLIEVLLAKPDAGQIALHTVTPLLSGNSVLLAVGILGATVMPHVVYLHSALTQHRIVPGNDQEARRVFRFEQVDIWIAMGLAGLVNGAMLIMAASVFFGHGFTAIATIQDAYRTLIPLLGPAAGVVFALALLASGLSSSTVGTMAGQVIMQGFTGWRIPNWLRRLITMLPALIVLGVGVDPTATLVISQVVLSFALPFAIVPLLLFTRRRDIMGALVNHRLTSLLGALVTLVIIALNLLLLWQVFSGLV